MSPRVSVIVPCYNYGHFVVRAIDSLLEQTLEDFEVIVVDDASTDDTPEKTEQYRSDPRVHLIRHEYNQGHIRSYNEALAQASGRYVGILSADDFCLTSTALERQVTLFEANRRIGMVYSAYAVVEHATGAVVTVIRPAPADGAQAGLDEFRKLMWGNYVLHSGTLLRRDVYEEIGPYDERLTQSGDWDLWLRAATRWDVGYVADALYAYRMHASNMQAKGIPPGQQADQNVLTLERAFASLRPPVPDDIDRARDATLKHALLQTTWFDVFNGRSSRAWRGICHGIRRQPLLLLDGEFWRLFARLVLLAAVGKRAYDRSTSALARVRERKVRLA